MFRNLPESLSLKLHHLLAAAMVVVLLMFGASFQYLVPEEQQAEHAPVSLVVTEERKLRRDTEKVPVSKEFDFIANKSFSQSARPDRPPALRLISDHPDTDKIRDPPLPAA